MMHSIVEAKIVTSVKFGTDTTFPPEQVKRQRENWMQDSWKHQLHRK